MEQVKQYVVADGLIDLGVKGGTFVRLEDYAALQQKLDAVLAENVSLKRIIHPIANEHTSVECTDRPVWYVCDPRQMMSPNASQLCHMFHGPFWSRERATEFMENTSYRYGAKASVFCTSLYHYPEMRRLYDASKNLQTPATDAILNEVRAGAIAAVPTVCDGKEQAAFEAYAQSKGLDLSQHPLHYLFLDEKTNQARSAWRECLNYVAAQLRAGRTEGGV